MPVDQLLERLDREHATAQIIELPARRVRCFGCGAAHFAPGRELVCGACHIRIRRFIERLSPAPDHLLEIWHYRDFDGSLRWEWRWPDQAQHGGRENGSNP